MRSPLWLSSDDSYPHPASDIGAQYLLKEGDGVCVGDGEVPGRTVAGDEHLTSGCGKLGLQPASR